MPKIEDSIPNYKLIHIHVGKKFGRLALCEDCGTTEAKRYDWANVSGRYDENDRGDWKRLCRSCHQKFDKDKHWYRYAKGDFKKPSIETRHKMSVSRLKFYAENPDFVKEHIGKQAPRTHCLKGHEFTQDNTILRPSRNGSRLCRICDKSRRERSKQRV